MDPDRFNELPYELQEHIISQRPELIRTFYQTNPDYNSLLVHDLSKIVCNKPISEKEYEEAEFKQLTTANLYHGLYSTHNFILILEIQVKNIFNDKIKILNAVKYKNGSVEFSDTIDGNYEEFSSVTDSLLNYTILKNRLSCIRLNPNYAKDSTIENLNDILDVYQNSYETQDEMHTFYLFNLYMMCVMNTYVYNIPYNFDITLLENASGNLSLIRQQINEMHTLIINNIL